MLAFNQSDTSSSPAIKASSPASIQTSNAATTSAQRPSASASLKAIEVAPQVATIVANKPADQAPTMPLEPEVTPPLTEAIRAPIEKQNNAYLDESSDIQIISREDFSENSLPIDQRTEKNALQFNGNWRGLVDALKLGLARTLAQNCELESFDENNINLTVPDLQKHLLDPNYQEKLSASINQHFGRKIKLSLKVGGTGNTPAKQIFEEKAAVQSEAESAIQQDDFVQALMKDFGANIIPSSIKPV
jgi:DNA polymerase-3 subunit gamma/tau